MKSVRIKDKKSLSNHEDNRLLSSQIKSYLDNFYSRLVGVKNTKKHHREIADASKRITEIVSRNNKISRLMNSSSYEYIKVRKRGLTGNINFGLGFCVDGRFSRIYFGPTVSTWEVPAGQIATEKRISDDKLIPQSHDLCEGIKKEVSSEKDLFEIFFAHYDSTDPHHGCAAMAGVLAAIKEGQDIPEVDMLTKSELKNLLQFKNPEDANLYLLEKTSLEAISNFYNTCRSQIGLKPLKQVGIVALYDTATMGIVLKAPTEILSTSELTNQIKESLESIIGKEVCKFGAYQKLFTNPDNFLEFSHKVLEVIELLLNTHVVLEFDGSEFKTHPNQFFSKINQFVNQSYPMLTDRQKQALRFFIARTVAFQYVTGLSEIHSSPTHPFASHNESYMAVSERGEFVGKYDTEQAFGSSAANTSIGIKQIKIEISVMNKTKSHKGKPFILFVCNPISGFDFRRGSRSMQRARANNASFVREIIADSGLGKLVKDRQLILIPTLIDDESREVLEIVDHSSYI